MLAPAARRRPASAPADSPDSPPAQWALLTRRLVCKRSAAACVPRSAASFPLESSSGLANARRLPEPSYASTSLIATCTHPCAPYEDEYQSESEDELAYARDVPSDEPSLSVADLRLSAYGS